MQALKEKYQNEIIDKIGDFDTTEAKEILDFINFLEKEKKKKRYQKAFKDLQTEFQQKLTLNEALKEIEDYRRGK